MSCEHKTEEEYAVCNRCSAFKRIAQDAKALLEARRALMDCLLKTPDRMDELQEEVQKAIWTLENSVKFADNAKLWD